MKKIIAMVLIAAVIAVFCGCSKETESAASVEAATTTAENVVETETAGSAPAGVPDPVVEYGSLEEINEAVGVNLMKPAVMGVSKERFSVIDGKIARYVCDINGREWTFRGACITDEDISGIFDERIVFVPGENYGIYANEFYLDRFFDGDRLTYRGEEIGCYTYDAEGNETSSDVTAANNLGYFEIKDSRLYWTGAAEEECRSCVFEKIVSE